MKKLLLLIVVFVFAVVGVHAATAVANGEAQAGIVAPITIAQASGGELEFGTWVQPDSAKTVVVAATSSPSHTAAGLTAAGDATPHAGHFEVTNNGVSYSVGLSSSISVTSSSNSMTVDTFTHSCTASCTDTDLYVGATLYIAASQAAGNYSGTYVVTLTY